VSWGFWDLAESGCARLASPGFLIAAMLVARIPSGQGQGGPGRGCVEGVLEVARREPDDQGLADNGSRCRKDYPGRISRRIPVVPGCAAAEPLAARLPVSQRHRDGGWRALAATGADRAWRLRASRGIGRTCRVHVHGSGVWGS